MANAEARIAGATRRPLRVAAFSGALGDWVEALSVAARGEHVDVLVGDYLAEYTMAKIASGAIAAGDPARVSGYFAEVFARQLAPELERIAARGMRVVTNAGAFNPAGLAALVQAEIARRGLPLRVARVMGDDLLARIGELVAAGAIRHLDTGLPPAALADRIVAANAYLGGWGIARALEEGADIVICGRVSDASLVVGPAAWWHGWRRDDWDRLAGAVAAGHVIECGPQATGGNFTGFRETGTPIRIGHPVAEIADDGSSVITKRGDEAGSVTVDTVTAQLMYEIQGGDYLNPDVVLHLGSIRLTQEAPDRVGMSQVRGSPPPATTKVGCFYPNGWTTMFWGYATGPEVDAKVAWFERQMNSIVATCDLDDYHLDALGVPAENPATKAAATIAIRVAAAAQQPGELAKLRAGMASFGMAGMPGYFGDTGLTEPRVDYWPGLVHQTLPDHRVVMDDGREIAIAFVGGEAALFPPAPSVPDASTPVGEADPEGATTRVVFADLVHARGGDKGADANLGIWVRTPAAWNWLRNTLTAAELGRRLGLQQDVAIERHELPNLGGLLFVLRGYFGISGSGNIGLDCLGKATGEFLRAQFVDAPAELLAEAEMMARD